MCSAERRGSSAGRLREAPRRLLVVGVADPEDELRSGDDLHRRNGLLVIDHRADIAPLHHHDDHGIPVADLDSLGVRGDERYLAGVVHEVFAALILGGLGVAGEDRIRDLYEFLLRH